MPALIAIKMAANADMDIFWLADELKNRPATGGIISSDAHFPAYR